MAQLGSGALILAFALALYGIAVSIIGARRRSSELITSGLRAVWGVTALILIAVIALATAFLTHDFKLEYVAGRSSRDMPLHYVLAAFYGGQQGSLLYWSLVAGVLSSIAIFLHRKRDRDLIPYVAATVLSTEVFFLFMLVFISSPFTLLPVAPVDGTGLNPLLRDPGMMMHPPFLLGGFASFTVPFGFAMAAMITGRLGDGWIRAIRRWALVAWGILGIGLLLGAWWAYHVLGWGGYWGWDPVENVALLPWLLATAFIHSIIVQERRGMLKVWNMSLIVGAYILAVFATFTVRSGLIQSVHTFATSSIGTWFLAYLTIVIVVAVGMLAYRVRGLRAERAIESVVSRESGFLLNNLLFTAMAFAIFWGTIFPLFSQLFGNKLTVGPPFYNQVNGPIMLALLILMGIGPLLAWRHTSWRPLLRSMRWSLIAAAVSLPIFALLLGNLLATIALAAVIFTVSTIIGEYVRGARVRHRSIGESYLLAIPSLLRKNNRRYGGYVVHLAMAVLAVGIIGTHFFQTERQFTMKPGDTSTIGSYTVKYNGLVDTTTKEGDVVSALIDVSQNGQHKASIASKRFFYTNFESQPTARMGIKTIGMNDVYVVLDRWDNDQTASIRIYINPMANWIWWGGMIFVLGMLTLLWPAARPARERASARSVQKAALSEA